MTNTQLEQKLSTLAREERRITNEILELLQLAEQRRLHLERGFSSMCAWLVKSFGYSEGAAMRRIQAARLLRKVPEAKEKLQAGTLNLSVLAKVQSALRAEEKVGNKVEPKAVVKKVEGMSTAAAEKTLLQLLPAFASEVKGERKMVNAEETRLAFTIPNEIMAKVDQLRDQLSHSHPNASMAELFAYALDKALEPKVVKPRATAAVAPHACKAEVERQIRAQGKCSYKDEKTGQECGSTYQLEIDHIKPRALGGSEEPTNPRLLCKSHNLFMGEKLLGARRMNFWRKT